jgi:(p)ppGpp synthase/HD superfamily hydrolase
VGTAGRTWSTRVAELLRQQGYDEDVCVAGLLHDVVEKSGVTVGEVREGFGPRVAVLVAALTEDATIEDWERRKSALRESAVRSGTEGVAIYIADKLANLHDWRAVYSEVGERSVGSAAPTTTRWPSRSSTPSRPS